MFPAVDTHNLQWLIEARGIDPYIATGRQQHGIALDTILGAATTSSEVPAGADAGERMMHKIKSPVGAALYRLRKQTVEPVFGIIIKSAGPESADKPSRSLLWGWSLKIDPIKSIFQVRQAARSVMKT